MTDLPSPCQWREAPQISLHRGYTSVVEVREVDGVKWALKLVGRRWMTPLWGRYFLLREKAILDQLASIEEVPRGRRWGQSGLLMEFRDGVPFTAYPKGSDLPDKFFDRLDHLVAEIHRRGVAHGDLQNRNNILVTEDFRPVILDFGLAQRKGHCPRPLFEFLCHRDRRNLAKYRRRFGRGEGNYQGRTELEKWIYWWKAHNPLHRWRKDRKRAREGKLRMVDGEVKRVGRERD